MPHHGIVQLAGHPPSSCGWAPVSNRACLAGWVLINTIHCPTHSQLACLLYIFWPGSRLAGQIVNQTPLAGEGLLFGVQINCSKHLQVPVGFLVSPAGDWQTAASDGPILLQSRCCSTCFGQADIWPPGWTAAVCQADFLAAWRAGEPAVTWASERNSLPDGHLAS